MFFVSFCPSACDKECSGCTGAGPDNCKACSTGFEETEGTCTGMFVKWNLSLPYVVLQAKSLPNTQ